MRLDPHVDLTERMLYLRSIPVVAALTPAELTLLAAHLQERTYPAGTALMREGEPVEAMHLLTRGSLSLSRKGIAMGQLKPPQSLGFLAILAQREGAYDAVCDEETRAFELETDALLDLMEDHFNLLHASLRYVGERLYYEMQELPEEALGSAVDPRPEIPARPLDLVERLFHLRRSSAFQKVNLNALAALSRQYEEVRYDAGARLWDAGDAPSFVFLLVHGTVVCRTPDGAKEFRYGPNTGVGGVDVLADRPRWYSATAETPILGLRGGSDRFVDLLEQNHSMARDFLASLAGGQIDLLVRKAALGQKPLAQLRNLAQVGAVPVGA